MTAARGTHHYIILFHAFPPDYGVGCATEQSSPGEGKDMPSLSSREETILRILALGTSNRQIARDLRISEAAVYVHLRCLSVKIGFESLSKTRALARSNASKIADFSS